MENEKSGEGEKGSCCSSGCGCWGKVIGTIVLVLLGWIVGYLMGLGHFCHPKKWMGMCPVMSAPQTTQPQQQQQQK